MSKIGKQPINIPDGTNVSVDVNKITIKGTKGELVVPILFGVKVILENKILTCELENNSKQAKKNWGTARALINNAVLGVTNGYEKTLVLDGVGYRITKEGDNLNLLLGFSHPVKYHARSGIDFEINKNTLKIKGIDKSLVGQVASEIRAMKKPEPYKGKGFHYVDEVIRRKAGKKAATTVSGK